MADADESIRREADIRIHNFSGHDNTLSMIQRMFSGPIPDVLACSIFGWNYSMFGRVAETFRQLNPNGLVVFGGTHVSNQAQRVFRQYPSVDVVANGEGEITFRELVRAHLAGRSRHELDGIAGISFKREDGTIVDGPERSRIVNLDDIPSPFLSGAMDLTLPDGRFRYDVVLMETNRGCPYKCAFCFWGGAIGQKLRSFSIERLREEIERFAKLEVVNVCLCDANFGMTDADREFMEVLIHAREKYGYPRHVVTSWAKNKGKTFYDIVSSMTKAGFHSSFTLALQTLGEVPLRKMGRKNMKVNEWEDLADWLQKQQLDVYGELIWGCPGETFESFLDGYDRLGAKISRIAVYPHLILPNSEYSNKREEFKFVTWRGGTDDFEYVLEHETMTLQENRTAHRFLFWARIVGEYMLLRYIWTPLYRLAGVRRSQVLLSLDRWLDDQPEEVASGLRGCRALVVDQLDAYAIQPGLQFFYTQDALGPLLERWWQEEISPLIPVPLREFFFELFRYDWATRPVLEAGSDAVVETIGTDRFYVREHEFSYDISGIASAIARGTPWEPVPQPRRVRLHYRVGFADYIANHEFYQQFVGVTRDEVNAQLRLPPVATPSAHASESTPDAARLQEL